MVVSSSNSFFLHSAHRHARSDGLLLLIVVLVGPAAGGLLCGGPGHVSICLPVVFLMVATVRSTNRLMMLAFPIPLPRHSDEYDFVLLPPPIDNARIAAAAPAAPFVLEAHKLGIATWALKLIFKEALGMFRRITADAAKTREGGKEGHGGNREEGDKKIAMQQNATRALLMINPDMYTAWNVRKRLIVEGKLR